jgi:glycosyltransferase involved in cell wall biosynthesis
MKILHVNKFFDQTGGVEMYLHRVMSKQAEAGHDVHAFSTVSSSNLPSRDASYFVHRYDMSRSEGLVKDIQKAGAFIWNIEARRGMERVLHEVKPDVVHLHNVYHHLSTSILDPIRASGVRCVQTLHDLKLACPNYAMFTEGEICERCRGGKYWNVVKHRCLTDATMGNVLGYAEMSMAKFSKAYERTVHRFITPSEFHRKKMIEWGEPANQFVVIRNPADVFDCAGESGGGYVLFAGRLSIEKGVDTLIRASALVPFLPVKIAGKGPDEERLKHLARTIGAVNVSFLGFVAPSELNGIRAKADAVINSSIWYENSPLTVLEAMGQGIPVIASNIGGVPELIENGEEGWLVPPKDVDAWAEALRVLVRTPLEVRREMGLKGMQRIREHHGWAEHLKKLEGEYRG